MVSDRQWREILRANAPKKVTVKDAAYECMRSAYMKASSGGTLPANARQVMYAARPMIIERTGKAPPWSKDSYFTQMLLPDYIREHPDETANWDIVYDDRGHLAEPHTGLTIGLGTLAVRQYLADWRGAADTRFAVPSIGGAGVFTCGPAHRFGAVLFIEKEGFTALLDRVRLAERYDIAIMSTKGVSVTAARTLVERLTRQGVPLFVIRDLDKCGLTIARTLYQDTRRFQFETQPNVIDLGLTLEDAQEMGLDPEPVTYGKADKSPRDEILACGATEEEASFLCDAEKQSGEWVGQRIELNAMDSGQFVAWIERKLTDAGVRKLIPDDATLAATYRRGMMLTRLSEDMNRLAAAYQPDSFAAPEGLTADVREILETSPDVPWDVAVRRCVKATTRAVRP